MQKRTVLYKRKTHIAQCGKRLFFVYQVLAGKTKILLFLASGKIKARQKSFLSGAKYKRSCIKNAKRKIQAVTKNAKRKTQNAKRKKRFYNKKL